MFGAVPVGARPLRRAGLAPCMPATDGDQSIPPRKEVAEGPSGKHGDDQGSGRENLDGDFLDAIQPMIVCEKAVATVNDGAGEMKGVGNAQAMSSSEFRCHIRANRRGGRLSARQCPPGCGQGRSVRQGRGRGFAPPGAGGASQPARGRGRGVGQASRRGVAGHPV